MSFTPVTVDVIVTNPVGASVPVAADHYVYATPGTIPTVSDVSPDTGSTIGGTSITLTGTHFTGTTGVTCGGSPCTAVVVVDDSHLTCSTPAHVAGNVHTKVTTSAGTSNATAADTFTFSDTVPAVTGVSPSTGGIAGGDSVVITGAGFTPATSVLFGATPATSFHVDSATQITAVSPAHAAGTVDVEVLVGSVSSPTSAADQFTFLGAPPATPTITAVTPSSGDEAGGTTIIIDGANLSTVTAVRVGGTPATSFTVDSPTVGRITAVVPAHTPGTVHTTVDNPDGSSPHTAADTFTYTNTPPPDVPAITGVSPDHGSQAGGNPVVITGTNFLAVGAVLFDTIPATSFTVDSGTQITAVAPAHGPGTVDITLVNSAGTSGIVPEDAYTYPGPPTITSVVPGSGTVDGGTTVTITGTNFE